MTICSKTLDAVEERLEERKSLEEIGRELCDVVDDHKGKALRLVKKLKGKDADQFLKDNADWLGYTISNVRERKYLESTRNTPTHKKIFAQNTYDVVSVPEATISEVVKDVEVKLKDSPKANIPPKIDTVPIVDKLVTNIKAINRPIDKIFQPIQNQKPIQPIITGGIDNEGNEGKCSIGKIIPDCNVCKFGGYRKDKNEWYCAKFYCMGDSCRFENRENQECKICGFTANVKEIFLEHAKLHKDEDIIQQAMQKIRHDDFLKDDVEMCPCGCGYGRGKTRWYSNKEITI